MWRHKPRSLPSIGALPEYGDTGLTERSRLFCLPPIGVGTAEVESLSSYLVRLARAHSVNPRHMIKHEFVRACEHPEKLKYVARRGEAANTLDGLGQHAAIFSEMTARLTTVPEVRALTLLPLADLLPHNGAGLLAKGPRWCPACLEEWGAQGDEIRRPLLWSLELYRVCHRHHRLLEQCCRSCGKLQPFLPIYPSLAHCVSCGRTLCRDGDVSLAKVVSDADSWMAEALCDLVTVLPALDGAATQERFMAFLKEAIGLHAGGKATRFCSQLGIPRQATKNWMTKGERPSLPQIMAIAYGLGVKPARIFLAPAQVELQNNGHQHMPAHPRDQPPHLTEAERAKLRLALSKATRDPQNTESLAAMTRRLGYSRSCLKYWFPELCAAIRAKHLAALQRETCTRRQADQRFLRNTVVNIAQNGEFPSARRISEALRPRGLILLRPDLREVYRNAVEEIMNSNRDGPATEAELKALLH